MNTGYKEVEYRNEACRLDILWRTEFLWFISICVISFLRHQYYLIWVATAIDWVCHWVEVKPQHHCCRVNAHKESMCIIINKRITVQPTRARENKGSLPHHKFLCLACDLLALNLSRPLTIKSAWKPEGRQREYNGAAACHGIHELFCWTLVFLALSLSRPLTIKSAYTTTVHQLHFGHIHWYSLA